MQPQQPQTDFRRLRAQIELARRASRGAGGFKYFTYEVFSGSFELGEFVGGDYIDDVCERMEAAPWTMDVTGRDHFKSTRLYDEIMHDVFTAERDLEGHYFSLTEPMSRYHLKKIKGMIAKNPLFTTVVDLNPQADSILEYWNGRAKVTVNPQSLLSFSRGIHADRIYVDDPLKDEDPKRKMAPTMVRKINDTIRKQIYPMVKKGGRCRVVGTPQTNEDIFFDPKMKRRYVITILDAMKDEANRVAVWPEWKSFDELEAIRDDIGLKSFNQEYRCRPAYTQDSYIGEAALMAHIDTNLSNANNYDGDDEVVGGFDIGRNVHPSHLALHLRWLEPHEVPKKGGGVEIVHKYHYEQLLSLWFDGMGYNQQVEKLKYIANEYNVSILRYDNTRAEFEAFAERGDLPKCMKPVVFSLKTKNIMAVSLDSVVTADRITLINDQRQTEQILAVTSDLDAMETEGGHGDSFWSNGLAVMEEKKKEFRVRTT